VSCTPTIWSKNTTLRACLALFGYIVYRSEMHARTLLSLATRLSEYKMLLPSTVHWNCVYFNSDSRASTLSTDIYSTEEKWRSCLTLI
jgi:hypothetical protein